MKYDIDISIIIVSHYAVSKIRDIMGHTVNYGTLTRFFLIRKNKGDGALKYGSIPKIQDGWSFYP